MKYPQCLTEAETVERAINGMNLARYGDGEFNLCVGRNCTSQRADKSLAAELRGILEQAPNGCLPCLPTPYGGTPKKANWQAYERLNIEINPRQEYGSAFITRADSAPWIDTATYWDRIRDLWRGKDIVLVKGSERSLRQATLHDAKSVMVVHGTYRDAYDARGLTDKRDRPDAHRHINELMEAIGRPGKTILLCLGAAATVMAARFAKLGEHAVDVGHLGMFMRHAGAYKFKVDDLISPEYRALLVQAHADEKAWGNAGASWAEPIFEFIKELDAQVVLDYGSGSGALAKKLAEMTPVRCYEYDAAFAKGLPKPVELVASTDVLEHVEPAKLNNVIDHIFSLSSKGVFLNIAMAPAKKILPDGRNAHLIIENAKWWLLRLARPGWRLHSEPQDRGKALTAKYVKDDPR